MDGRAVHPEAERDVAAVGHDTAPGAGANKVPPAKPVEDWPAGGQGGAPFLTLDGFAGPLDHLLTLARAEKIAIGAISLAALVDQLASALQRAARTVPLGQQAGWVVMAAWLVQLRTRLLLPAEASAAQGAQGEADELRGRLVALDEIQALAGWLARRPQRGHDVFARGRPEMFGVSVEAGPALDVVEFLWASLALFDDADKRTETASVYQARPFAPYPVAAARARILQLLAESPDGAPLARFLPELATSADQDGGATLGLRSAWASTFSAGLELAKQGAVVLGQGRDFTAIHVAPASAGPPG
jgi:segregation and condensation protein A